MTIRKYFGTDGIRGKVGESAINPEFVMRLGYAAAIVLAGQATNTVLISLDTRLSGSTLESTLEAGLSSPCHHLALSVPISVS